MTIIGKTKGIRCKSLEDLERQYDADKILDMKNYILYSFYNAFIKNPEKPQSTSTLFSGVWDDKPIQIIYDYVKLENGKNYNKNKTENEIQKVAGQKLGNMLKCILNEDKNCEYKLDDTIESHKGKKTNHYFLNKLRKNFILKKDKQVYTLILIPDKTLKGQYTIENQDRKCKEIVINKLKELIDSNVDLKKYCNETDIDYINNYNLGKPDSKSDDVNTKDVGKILMQYLIEDSNEIENNIKLKNEINNLEIQKEGEEGGSKEAEVLLRERNPVMVLNCKERDGYKCKTCSFFYDKKIVECHHLEPLSTKDGKHTIKLDKLITLCPNCHKIAHMLLRESEEYEKLDRLLQKIKEILKEIKKHQEN